jgi:predicted DNA-binding transcriptional regulator YafY
LHRFSLRRVYNEILMKTKRSSRERNPEQKLNCLYVFWCLLWHSDAEHPLTSAAIQARIAGDFGVNVLRKAVHDDIEALQLANAKARSLNKPSFLIKEAHDKDKRKTAYYWIEERLFTEAELRYLIDAIYSSRAITGAMAKSLIAKLASTLEEEAGKKKMAIHRAFSNPRSVNRALFLNLATLEEAIETKKQIRFYYSAYDLSGELRAKRAKDGSLKLYQCAPYFLTLANESYYLVCYFPAYPSSPTYFRIDFMTGIHLLEKEDSPELSSLPCFQHFDIDSYMNERLYSLKGDPTYCLVRIDDPKAITYLYDRFGTQAQLYQENGQTYGKIYCAPNAFYFWAMAYVDELTVLGPEKLVGWMQESARKILQGGSR